jgi:hypothetical protein
LHPVVSPDFIHSYPFIINLNPFSINTLPPGANIFVKKIQHETIHQLTEQKQP